MLLLELVIFNIPTDNPNDSTLKERIAFSDTFDLTCHVSGPTCIQGHPLDLVISKGLNVPTVNVKDGV